MTEPLISVTDAGIGIARCKLTEQIKATASMLEMEPDELVRDILIMGLMLVREARYHGAGIAYKRPGEKPVQFRVGRDVDPDLGGTIQFI